MTPTAHLKRHKIPYSILLPHGRAMHHTAKRSPEDWTADELRDVRARCGPDYAGVPLHDVQHWCNNQRKNGDYGSVVGHGPGPRRPVSTELQAYFASPEWARKRLEVLKHYGNRCMICGRTDVKLDIHHNTYDSLYDGTGRTHIVPEQYGTEPIDALIPICRDWHRPCDMHRRRSTNKGKKNGQGTMF